MCKDVNSPTLDANFMAAFQARTLTDAAVSEFAAQPQEVIVFTLLTLMGQQQTLAAHQPPSTMPMRSD